MRRIVEVENRKSWNKLVMSFGDYTFLQTWEWGEINENKRKEKVLRWEIRQGKETKGIIQAFTISAKRGKILFVPHGPLTKDEATWQLIIQKLKKKAKEWKCDCLRISPWEVNNKENQDKYIKAGFCEAGVIMHAEDTWIVDLTGTEEEVMMRMRKTTRNLIRKGIKENIKIWQSDKIEDVDYLFDLQMEVVKRNNFVPFSKSYLKKELEVFTSREMAKLFLGAVEQGVMGAALIVFLGKFAFYYQSGSRESKQPINYLLQWEVIKEARKRGCEKYNMWGIAPDDNLNHPWRGLTIFKTGFGGETIHYMKAMDFPINQLGFWKLKLLEKIPKTWRQKIKLV